MRAVVLLGLVAAAFAAKSALESPESQWSNWESMAKRQHGNIDVEQFKKGHEYTFWYEGQIASGLPIQTSNQNAISRGQSLVSVVFTDETSGLLQIQKIRVGSTQREVSEPRDLQPFELFEEIELIPEHQRLFRLPIRFRYERGLITEVEFDSEEQAWTANIKRGILNMLQVNLDKRAEIPAEYEQFEKNKQENEDFYLVKERTVEGDCETIYTQVPLPSRRDVPAFRLTKSINFEKCSERPGLRYNFRFGKECPTCDEKFTSNEKNIHSSTVFTYNITGQPGDFIIREVEGRSQYVYTPLEEQENVFFQANLHQRMTLIKSGKTENKISAPKSPKKESLLYSSEWEQIKEKLQMNGEEQFIRETPLVNMKNKPEIVSKLVKLIVKEIGSSKKSTGVELESVHHMSRLVKVLRIVTKEEIAKIHREVCENEEYDKEVRDQVRDVINDALALAGTFNTVEHLVEKITKNQLSEIKAASVLKTLINIRTPSEKIIDSLVKLAKDSVSERSPLIKQSAWLTTGALINGLCGEHRDQLAVEENGKVCPRTLKEKYVELLQKQFTKASTRYEKVLALKTIANAGLDLSVFPLEEIISDERQEKTVRLQAIDALRQLRNSMPRKIQSILMPIYKNHREHPEVRAAAFHQIMQTVPQRSILDQIAQQLEREPSQQVYSFVYSALKTYSMSTIPCEERMAHDIKQSLRLARVQPRKLLASHLLHGSWYQPENKMGGSINWANIFSNDSVIPKEVMASLETVFAGQWNKYLAQVGFTQQNIDQVIMRVLSKIEEKGLDEILVRGKRSAAFRPVEMLRSLVQKLSIKTRRMEAQDPHAMVYIRFRDLDYAVLPIDEETIPEMIRTMITKGKIELGQIEQVLAKGYRFQTVLSSFVYERTQEVITSFGVPLVFSSKMPTIGNLNGQIYLELEPKNGQTIDGLRLRFVGQPSIASTHVTKMEMYTPILNHGIKLLHSAQANLPLDVTIEMNWEKKFEIKTTIKVPEEKKRLVQVQTRPTTFVRVWPKESRTYVEPKERTIYVRELEQTVRHIDGSFLEKETGLRVEVVGNVPRHYNYQTLLHGENSIEVTLVKGRDTPREYVIKVEGEAFKKASLSKPDFEKFFEKQSEKEFEIEDSEWENEDETERRKSFKSYISGYETEKAYEHRVFVKVNSVGASIERFAESEVSAVCDQKLRYCKWNVESRRSPVGEERKNWDMKAEMKTLYPEMPATLKELLEQKHREFHAMIDAKWGAEQKNTINVRIQGEQNGQQKRWIKNAQKSEEQYETQLEQYSKLVEASQLNQYKVVADYKIESEVTKSQLSRVYALLKSYNFWSTEVSPLKEREGRVFAQLTIEPESRQHVNVTVETPYERVQLRDLRMPVPLVLVNIRRQHSPVNSMSELSQRISNNVQNNECEVSSTKVNTFDDLVYRAPLTTCYSVLAKDCASDEPAFVILMKKIQKNGEEKKLKIFTPSYVIELEGGEQMKIRLNGEEQKTSSKRSSEKLEDAGVYKHGDYVTVELEGVQVHFDGYRAKIKMSDSYKNQQCGLCGHFDGEKENDFRRADNEETDEIEQFHRSYLARDEEQCEVEEDRLSEKKNYRLLSEESSSSEETIWGSDEDEDEKRVYRKRMGEEKQRRYNSDNQETREPEDRTYVYEYSQKICFSKEVVPECPRNTITSDNTKEMKVKFGCLSRSDSDAQRLLRRARRGEIISDVKSFADSTVETLQVPTECVVY